MSLPLPAYIAFLRIIEAQSLDPTKLIDLIEMRSFGELRSLVLTSPYATIYDKALSTGSLTAFEREAYNKVSSYITEVARYAPEPLDKFVKLYLGLFDVENLLRIAKKGAWSPEELIPIGILYNCISSQQVSDIESLSKCIEVSGLGEALRIDEFVSMTKDRLALLNGALCTKARLLTTLSDFIDRTIFTTNAIQAYKEWAYLELMLTKVSLEMSSAEGLEQAKSCLEEAASQLYTKLVSKPILDFIQSMGEIAKKNIEKLSYEVTKIIVREVLPKLKIPGDDIDLLLYVLILKVVEMRLLRYALALQIYEWW